MTRALGFYAAVVSAAAIPALMDVPAVQAGTVVLAPHRAVYELKLLRTPGKRQIESVRGRILYDFSGSPCEGYILQFRQVSELDSGEGKVALSDLRANTWEEGDAKSFRFNSTNYLNEKAVEAADGNANRDGQGVTVKLAKPDAKTLNLSPNIVFPTEHMRRIIEAAQAGKTILEFPVYDGSENGQKVFDTLTVIGRPIPPDEKKPTDAAAGMPQLANMTRWPVTISYFDRTTPGGEQTPVYAIGFEMFENGISRALSLDYGDFVVGGEMKELQLKEAKACN
ncbi:MAG: cell envelope integrity EipB family protein [Xanthobacteraceae bacterium]|nr:cell envelope integrity EipB family protein [Xanthobacteraceae bacterium]